MPVEGGLHAVLALVFGGIEILISPAQEILGTFLSMTNEGRGADADRRQVAMMGDSPADALGDMRGRFLVAVGRCGYELRNDLYFRWY